MATQQMKIPVSVIHMRDRLRRHLAKEGLELVASRTDDNYFVVNRTGIVDTGTLGELAIKHGKLKPYEELES